MLPADATNGVDWMFVYTPSETTYKWRFVGGAPMFAQGSPGAVINTLTQVGATGNYYQAATMSVTVPRAGDYAIQGDIRFNNNSGAANWIAASAFQGTTAGNAWFGIIATVATETDQSLHAQQLFAGVSASTVVGVCANSGAVGTYKVAIAYVSVIPIRVI